MIDIAKTLDPTNVKKFAGSDSEKQAIFEKSVYSFLLLEQLDTILNKKNYVFKGGTSILLLFKDNSRFSIDVDICMDELEYDNRYKLEKEFIKNIQAPFQKVELEKSERKHGGRDIKCAHYRFFYNPKYKTNENYVILDIVYQDNSFNVSYVDVDNNAMKQLNAPKQVRTISIDDLFGDKLVAFAPNTVGVKYNSKNQYNRPKYCEIIKQLHDCAYLSTFVTDLNRIKDIYLESANFQIKSEHIKGLTIKKCLIDTIKTCELILSKGKYGDSKQYTSLLSGTTSFNHYKIGPDITDVDLQRYAFRVQIYASRILLLIDNKIHKMDKLDYLLSRNLKEKNFEFFTTNLERNDYFNYCLLDL